MITFVSRVWVELGNYTTNPLASIDEICMQGLLGNLDGQVEWVYGLTLGHRTSQKCMQGHNSNLVINKVLIFKERVLINKIPIYKSWN